MTVKHVRTVIAAIAASAALVLAADPADGLTSTPTHRIAARAHATALRDLLSAPVPALRGNPAGRLRNGVLPDPEPGGYVALDRTFNGHPAFGDLTHDGVRDAAAVIDATSGAGGGDQYVEIYTRYAKRLAQFNPAAAVHALHANVLAVKVRREHVLIDYLAQMDTGKLTYWSARLTWLHGHLSHRIRPHTGITRSGIWSDSHVVITPRSLGAVHVGMTVNKAEIVSRFYFDNGGDGYIYPSAAPGNHLYIGQTATSRVRCVGATDNGASWQRIATPRGVGVGDPVSLIRKKYGRAAHYVRAPQGGMNDYAGYTVTNRLGTLVFFFNAGSPTIYGIGGGAKGLTPNSCTG